MSVFRRRPCTLATALKAQGYTTGQFGKNHLGDLNKYLPTVHGFDEFFGYLYHLDAMSDPYWYSFPADEKYYNTYGPRSLVHTCATDRDDPTESHVGVRSANRGSSMKVHCSRSRTCRTCRHARPAVPKGQVRYDDLR